jgi:hypothetical protein
MTGKARAQLFSRNRAAAAVVGACATAVFAGETQGLELAVNGAGAKAHDGLPLKASLPLSDSYIAVQHGFGNGHGRDPALRRTHGCLHNLFMLMII